MRTRGVPAAARVDEGYDLGGLAEFPPHAGRPAPVDGRAADGRRSALVLVAVLRSRRPRTWRRIGGFDEEFLGYGAEDTDFGFTADAAGIGLTWVGGATAYHQWHPSESPPIRHLDDILRNGRIFARRWGWWPMEGWLEAFQARGLIRWDDDEGDVRAHLPLTWTTTAR